jgi:SCY1-like protein 1
VLTIITKLSDRTINGELLRHLAKTANDEQPGIRTNTTICLGKIAKNLGTSSRAKVLTAAFSRSLRDPFVHARNAALLALGATVEYFPDDDCAAKILPAICPLLLDKEKLVRDQANKAMDIFLHKIRKAASSMPDSVLPPPSSAAESGPRMSTPQPAESAAVAWAGWAISSFTNKISAAAGEIQPSTNGSSALASPAAKVDAKRPGSALRTASASNLHRQALKSPPTSAPMSRAATQDNSLPDNEPEAEAEQDAADQFNAEIWGDMEEMDDEADNDANGDAWGTASNAWGSVAGDESSAASTTKSPSPSITTAKRKEVTAKPTSAPRPAPVASATPFGDDEPDFAGWLAAQQASKKGAGAKALPKGLAKTTTPASGATGAKKPAAKPVVAKKIDLKPKADNDDDSGWGDGW